MRTVAEIEASLKSNAEATVCLVDKADGEKNPTDEQMKSWQEELDGLNTENERLHAERLNAERFEAARTQAKGTLERVGRIINPVTFGTQPESRGDLKAITGSLGEGFLASENVKAWLGNVMPGGVVLDRRVPIGTSPPVGFDQGVKALLRALPDPADTDALKALVTAGSATSGGPFINIDYRGLLDRGTFERPLRIADLVTKVETSSDTVEYIRLGSHTNAAAPVAEATATGGASGVKPESTLVTEAVTDTIKTIAHWMPATRRVLQDAPALRALIDAFLRYGLAEELEDQIIAGAGTGENFTGVLNTSGTTAQAFDTDLLTTYRKARTKVLITGRAFPTAYVIHPNDWEDLDLLTDNEERYYFGGPVGVGTPRLWGVPVVESEAMTEGTAVLADWRLAVLWDRMQTMIYVSDSHADMFIRNMIAILAELRAGFGILRPAAFVEIALS